MFSDYYLFEPGTIKSGGKDVFKKYTIYVIVTIIYHSTIFKSLIEINNKL